MQQSIIYTFFYADCKQLISNHGKSKLYLHHVRIKRCHWFFHNNFYKYARIFMNFGKQHCKWIIIILVNLLRCMPCTSLIWWRNVDVTEIMPFTDDDKHFIKILHKEKRYSSRKFIREFPNKNWSRHGLDHLIKTFWTYNLNLWLAVVFVLSILVSVNVIDINIMQSANNVWNVLLLCQRFSHGMVATQRMYSRKFLRQWLSFSCEVVHEKLWKSVNICKSYSEKISGTFLSGHGVCKHIKSPNVFIITESNSNCLLTHLVVSQ